MGLRDKYGKTNTATFKPLELNEMNVQILFKRCLTTTDEPKPGIDLTTTLFDTYSKYRTDRPVCFNIKKVEENKRSIEYLFGQLQSVHNQEKRVSPEASFINYSGKPWTTNSRYINGISLLS